MKRQLKILSAIDIPWNSGLAAYACDQALALRAGGHAVVFACPEGSAAMEFASREKFKAVPIPGRRQHHLLPLALWRLRAAAREENIDIVCAHTGRTQTLGALLGLPLVRVKADVKTPAPGFAFTAAARTVAASGYIKDLYLRAGLDPLGIEVIRQGITLPEPPSAPPAAVPLKVGLLGRLDPVKGHEVFLKAAAQLLRAGNRAEFHIAGYEANLKYADLLRLAEELDIKPSVVFHGRTEGPFGFMAGCDIGVIASLGSEAVSRAALEWLAAGRPLVSSSAGSLPEYVSPQWLVPPGDHAALAAKIGSLLESPGTLSLLGGENRSRAASDFSNDAFTSATCALFEGLAGV
jgi:glycosyltransferase involved in cell wall biosynthesis